MAENNYQRVYEPWQDGIDDEIAFLKQADVRDKLHKVRDNILTLGEDSLRLARHLSYRRSEENDRLAVEWLRYGSKAYAAYFELAREPEKEQTVQILDLPPVTWNGRGILEGGRVFPTRWQTAYFLAAVMRDRESMDSLARFPVEILRQSATKNSEAEYLLVEALQSLHLGRSDYGSKLMDFSSSVDLQNADDWLLDITLGKFETLLAFTTNRDADFNEMLAKNLAAHCTYYERNTPEDQAPVKSWIAIELLCMACMVYDRGEPVTVESDYIPRFLLEGTYL
ncbi:hypothetical protein Dvar_49880 [Desulfosarcina variabilis str. Montpellier]|uniref:immunity 49 family protein n=1 Tax=Desulfosarcina variabilis TaxID=2300 RepID=UPI003AFA6EA3